MQYFCEWIEENVLLLSRNNYTGVQTWLSMTPDELCRWVTADIRLNREINRERKRKR